MDGCSAGSALGYGPSSLCIDYGAGRVTHRDIRLDEPLVRTECPACGKMAAIEERPLQVWSQDDQRWYSVIQKRCYNPRYQATSRGAVPTCGAVTIVKKEPLDLPPPQLPKEAKQMAYTEKQARQAVKLALSGMTYDEACRKTGVPKGSMTRLIERYGSEMEGQAVQDPAVGPAPPVAQQPVPVPAVEAQAPTEVAEVVEEESNATDVATIGDRDVRDFGAEVEGRGPLAVPACVCCGGPNRLHLHDGCCTDCRRRHAQEVREVEEWAAAAEAPPYACDSRPDATATICSAAKTLARVEHGEYLDLPCELRRSIDTVILWGREKGAAS